MSKSLGNIIYPRDLIKKYGADSLRYYLLAEIPASKDGDFSLEKFEARYNGDLALGLGNYLARIVGLGEKHLDKPLKSEMSVKTKQELDKRWKKYETAIQDFKFSDAIKEIQTLISFGDKRINNIKLWELVQNDNERFKKEISDVATLLAYVAWMFLPIIPNSSEEIFRQLGINKDSKTTWKFKMKKGQALFPRL